MTPDELAAQLRPVRMPAEFATFGLSDALAAFSCAVLLTMAAMLLARPLFARKADPMARVNAEIGRLAGLEPGARLYGLARLLETVDPQRSAPRSAEVTRALYDPVSTADPAGLERQIRETVRSAGKAGA